jgi:hypothetical protein
LEIRGLKEKSATLATYALSMKILCLCLFACGSTHTAVDDTPDPMDATIESSADSSTTSDVATHDATDDTSQEDSGAQDSGSLYDAGSLCPPCMQNYLCCMAKNSPNYGKCVSGGCLSCCQ